ncbi:hypothetical protein SBOR_5178 [Sclerotinia borealis F-4128]|uniref:Uncharacterized protein n=1 Tax=Sclerotinia borealis (strain F-4128) TaxID=1432307 RepID=W9CIV8_SCLBF|nr:hypothetical protein SBOR_5178 [Sclerotinia borealis F-4128]
MCQNGRCLHLQGTVDFEKIGGFLEKGAIDGYWCAIAGIGGGWVGLALYTTSSWGKKLQSFRVAKQV